MEKTLMMPAYYNVMSQEEMTYTEGGATMCEALLALIIPPYGWYKGVMEIRSYRKKNPNTWMETGVDYFLKDMGKSFSNFLYDLACASYVIGSSATGVGLLVNAALILG